MVVCLNEASANEEAAETPPPARSTPPPCLLCTIQSSDRPTQDGPGEVFQGQICRVGLDPPSSLLLMGKKCCQGIFEKVRDKRCDELSGLRGEGSASSLHLLLSQQRGGQGTEDVLGRWGPAPVARPAKPVHRRHPGAQSPLPVGPQGQQRPEACLECSSFCRAALAPERAPSIHLGLPFSPLPFLVALLHGSQSGIFRIPRNGARSWGVAMPGDTSWDARDSRVLSCVAGSFCRPLLRPLVGLGAFFSPAVSPSVGEESFLPCPSLSLELSPVIAVWHQEMLVHPVLVLASRMALGKSPPLCGPQLPHL